MATQKDFIVKNGFVILNGQGVVTTGTSSGALVVTNGGIGAGGDIYAGGILNVYGGATIGRTTSTDKLVLSAQIQSDLIPTTSTYSIGSTTTSWNSIFSKSLRLTGGVDSINTTTGDLIISGGASILGNNLVEGITYVNSIVGNPITVNKTIDSPLSLKNLWGDLVIRGFNPATGSTLSGGSVTITAGVADPFATSLFTRSSGYVKIQGSYMSKYGADATLNSTASYGVYIQGSGDPNNDVNAGGLSKLGRPVLIEAGNKATTFIQGGRTYPTSGVAYDDPELKGGDLVLNPGFNLSTATDNTGKSLSGSIYIGTDYLNQQRYARNITIGNSISTTTVYGPTAFSTTTGALVVRGGIGAQNLYLGKTPATNTYSGALIVEGGVGVGGKLYASELYDSGSRVLTFGALATAGVTKINAGTGTSISTSTGEVTIWSVSTLQGVTDLGSVTTNTISITNTTLSTSTNTGALTVSGGIGAQNLYLGAAASTSTTTGALIVAGGIGVGGTATIFTAKITSTVNSISTVTGALTVAGGLGVSKDSVFGGFLSVNTNTINMSYPLYINGPFAAVSKSFLITHPTKPNMKLCYASLEGPENGVYVRGRTKSHVIELPDYWTGLVDASTITVSLTPIGKHQKLYVAEIIDNKVYIANDGLFAGEIDCFYVVYGERKDIDKLTVEY